MESAPAHRDLPRGSDAAAACCAVQMHDAGPMDSGGQEALAQLRCRRLVAGTRLTWPPLAEPGVISLTVATDLRAPCLFAICCGGSAPVDLDAGYASHAQRLRLAVPAGCSEAIITGCDTPDAHLLVIDDPDREPGLSPRLVPASADLPTRRRRAMQRLADDALCQYSWMGGCVLEAFDALAEADPAGDWAGARRRWLGRYWHDGELHFQDPRGNPRGNEVTDIEATLPVATIAAEDPRHPACTAALAWWRERGAGGAIIDHGMTSAEGNYTLAYPMARIARLCDDQALRRLAVAQLELRRERLLHDGSIYLRHDAKGLTYRDWTRGICWYLLGLARVLAELGPENLPGFAEHLSERCRWIIVRQRDDGLWDNFLGEPGPPPDASGSAGIAAALLHAHRLGLAPDTAIATARRCWSGLGAHLEPDGWLGCVAPNNKRGEVPQHGQRRTVEPFALGLYGQLAAGLMRIR